MSEIDLLAKLSEAREEINRLQTLINTPELKDFSKALEIEMVHQRARWGNAHDANKHPHDWCSVIIVLLGKAVKAFWDGDRDKLKHHIITVAAVCGNWHARECAREAST